MSAETDLIATFLRCRCRAIAVKDADIEEVVPT